MATNVCTLHIQYFAIASRLADISMDNSGYGTSLAALPIDPQAIIESVA